MGMSKSNPSASRARNAAASRSCILEHAIAEFATQGVAGARTASIAEAAGVNKALLYYYFKDKESLYSASLQVVFSGLVGDVLPLLESGLAPGEKVLRLARVHFEYLIHHPELSAAHSAGALTCGQWRRALEGFSRHQQGTFHSSAARRDQGDRRGHCLGRVSQGGGRGRAQHHLRHERLSTSSLRRSCACCAAPIHFLQSAFDGHVATSLDFIGASLFTDRKHGIKLAKKIAAAASAQPRELRGGRERE